jgi:hypothetical protein
MQIFNYKQTNKKFKSSQRKIYQTVIDEVIQNVREQFLDEGYDDQFLQELKTVMESINS